MKTTLEPKKAELDKLAQEIRDAVGQVGAAFRKALEHARNVGALLKEAKRAVRRAGAKWQEWVQANCAFGDKTAANYMRIAEEWDYLSAHPNFNSETTISDALKLLAVPTKKATGKTTLALVDGREGQEQAGGGERQPLPPGYRVSIVPRPGYTLEAVLNVLRTLAEVKELDEKESDRHADAA